MIFFIYPWGQQCVDKESIVNMPKDQKQLLGESEKGNNGNG